MTERSEQITTSATGFWVVDETPDFIAIVATGKGGHRVQIDLTTEQAMKVADLIYEITNRQVLHET